MKVSNKAMKSIREKIPEIEDGAVKFVVRQAFKDGLTADSIEGEPGRWLANVTKKYVHADKVTVWALKAWVFKGKTLTRIDHVPEKFQKFFHTEYINKIKAEKP